jgi:hypothetical protein
LLTCHRHPNSSFVPGGLLAALIASVLLMGVLVPTAPAATPTATTTASAAAAAATTTSTAAPAAAATTTPTATVPPSTSATAASAPTVKLSPTGSGSGTTVTASVKVEGCPAGKITIADTIGGGTQTIATNGAPATVVSHGTPGTYSVTATCVNGAHASVPFVVTKVKGPSIKLSPASTGPTPTTINVSVQGCPPGKIKITDTINDGSQTIKKDGAPATIPSPGTPGKYSVTAKCSADGATAKGSFVVDSGDAPKVTIDPSTTGPVTKTINVVVTGCPPGKIKITDTINDGSQTIKKDKAPATIVSQGNPGTYSVTAKCSDGAKAQAPFVVTPDGPIQTGGGSTFQKAQGPGWPMGIGLAMLILGSLGAFGLGYRWWRRRDSSQ